MKLLNAYLIFFHSGKKSVVHRTGKRGVKVINMSDQANTSSNLQQPSDMEQQNLVGRVPIQQRDEFDIPSNQNEEQPADQMPEEKRIEIQNNNNQDRQGGSSGVYGDGENNQYNTENARSQNDQQG